MIAAVAVGVAAYFAPAALGQQPAPGAPDGTASKVKDAPPASEKLDEQTDKILTRLQDQQVRDLHAKVEWKSKYVIEDEDANDRKLGEIWYKEFDPVPKFLVHFTQKIASQKRETDEKHMFDGRWYTELQSSAKTVIRREVRRANDPANPYRIGEGVFPLPFGQKKEDVLREFSVKRMPPAKDDPPGTDHLRLTPREGTRSGKSYQYVDFWISNEGKYAGLPIKVLTAKKDGTGRLNSFLTITFSEIRLNEGFSGNKFEIKTPAGFEEVIETLDPVPPPGAAEKGGKP